MNDARAQKAIDFFKGTGAHAEARLIRHKYLTFFMENGNLSWNSAGGGKGIGVRAIVGAGDAFMGGSADAPEEAARNALRRAEHANNLNAELGANKIELGRNDSIARGDFAYRTVVLENPFNIENQIKEYLREVDERLKAPHVTNRSILVEFDSVHVSFMNTEGLNAYQEFMNVSADMSVSGVRDGRTFERSYDNFMLNAQGGFERIRTTWDLLGNTQRVVDELNMLMRSEPSKAGLRKLLLDASMLGIMGHETSGHVFELDRLSPLLYEVGFAGSGHLRPGDAGWRQFGNERVTIYADATHPGGAGSYGVDDEGVLGRKFPLVQNGKVMNFLNSRKTVEEAGELLPKHARHCNGCARADLDYFGPIPRMTNIYLATGDGGTFDEMVRNTDNALLIRTPNLFSIDPYRRNAVFGGEIGFEIEDGKVVGVVQSPAFQIDGPRFWEGVQRISSTFEERGVSNCAKGVPDQAIPVGHPMPSLTEVLGVRMIERPHGAYIAGGHGAFHRCAGRRHR